MSATAVARTPVARTAAARTEVASTAATSPRPAPDRPSRRAPQTVVALQGGGRPGVRPGAGPRGPRLLLAPCGEPAPARALSIVPSLAPPPVHSVRSPVTEASWPVASTARPTPVTPPEDPTDLCGSIVLAAVEAVTGRRPVMQLARWVSPQVFEALHQAARSRGPQSTLGRRTSVRSTHLSRLSPTVAEASVVIHDGTRVRAAAVRLEVHRAHWRATVLQIG